MRVQLQKYDSKTRAGGEMISIQIEKIQEILDTQRDTCILVLRDADALEISAPAHVVEEEIKKEG